MSARFWLSAVPWALTATVEIVTPIALSRVIVAGRGARGRRR